MDWLNQLLNATGFMPHGHCYLWKPDILWLHVLSDGLIGLAYFIIPYSLLYILRKRQLLRYGWMVGLFGLFIFSCGATHWMDIVTVWNPLYRLDGLIKALTALASVGTAVALAYLTPALVGLPSKQAWEEVNAQLQDKLGELQTAQEQLRRLNQQLEQRVEERTAELQQRESEMRLLTDALPVLISYIDSDLRYRLVNQAYQDWFGLPKESLVGQPVAQVLGSQAFEVIEASLRQALAGQPVQYLAEMPYRQGGRRQVSTHLIPDLRQGRVVGFYALVSDVTELKRTQQALERALEQTQRQNRQLVRINNDLDNFVYTASHDLKAPIANIEGLMNVLTNELRKKGQGDAFTQRVTAMIGQSIARFQETIGDLADVARLQKQAEQPREALVVAEVVADVLTDLQLAIQEAGAVVEQHLEADARVAFPRRNLQSVIHNLVGNALKYRSPDREPRIHLSCHREQACQVLTVSDNGVGMPAGYQDKIFGLFKRLHSHVEGTGIGLYIVKQMVEQAGGEITVESKLGEGSTFRVFLPASDGPTLVEEG